MIVENNIQNIRKIVKEVKMQGKIVGLVPTMGALHSGHISLVKEAKKKCDFVAMSIFVNPTQFGEGEDYGVYPRTLDADLKKCEEFGVDLVFTPTDEIMYLKEHSTWVDCLGINSVLEGAIRPIHFRGVSTVCTKLFNIVTPDYGFFGQKDYQQVAVLKKMVRELNTPIEIITCPIIRDVDNLALSSRNVYLSEDERNRALYINKALFSTKAMYDNGERDVEVLKNNLITTILKGHPNKVDYISIFHKDTLEEATSADNAVMLVACKYGNTRLIDNMLL